MKFFGSFYQPHVLLGRVLPLCQDNNISITYHICVHLIIGKVIMDGSRSPIKLLVELVEFVKVVNHNKTKNLVGSK